MLSILTSFCKLYFILYLVQLCVELVNFGTCLQFYFILTVITIYQVFFSAPLQVKGFHVITNVSNIKQV